MIDQVAHGDVNRDVKTAGRVTVGNLVVEKLLFSRLELFHVKHLRSDADCFP